MKIAVVMWGDDRVAVGGGAERRFSRVFARYCRRAAGAVEVHLIANPPLFRAMEAAQILDDSFHAQRCCVIGGEGLRSAVGFNRLLVRCLRSIQPDVVHLPLVQRSLTPFYLWLAVDRSFPVVVSVTLAAFASSGRPPPVTLLLSQLLWRRATLIDSLYPGFAAHYGRSFREKIRVGPGSFTDPEVFRPAVSKSRMVTFVGRLVEEKSPHLFIEAWRLLNYRRPDLRGRWRACILGDGPLRGALMRRLGQSGLENVTLEAVHSVAPYVGRSQIFISIQRSENYPSQALLEAMAAGNAVIATDVGDTGRLVDDTVGLLVPPSDAAGLATALETLISDDDRRLSCGEAARRRILAGYTLDDYCAYLEELWRAACS